MRSFESISFFLLLIVVSLPAIWLGFSGKKIRIYGFIATVVMLLALFWTVREKILLASFWAFQTALCRGYLALRRKDPGKTVFWIFLILSIAPLFAVKLTAFFPALSFLQFAGISYLTFRAVQVIIEIGDGRIETLDLLDFSYFILFFPAVSSGPIDRYRRFCTDLHAELSRKEYSGLFRNGLWNLMVGAVYYFAFGNLIWQLWLQKLPASGFLPTVSYLYGYTFFMFFNFAGYSRMAVGTAYLFGVRLPDNFRAPFLSCDLKDFWSRWHISLSTFLRDYVYTRFCMTAVRKKWFSGGRASSYLGYFLTMSLMGLWHGFSWGYLIYGVYHGVLMSVNDILDTKWKKFRKYKRGKVTVWICRFVTFHLFAFGLLIFSGRIVA